jgi:excisionase family DNA binding protein
MSVTPQKLLYTKKEAAAALAMSERRLDRLVSRGDICAVRDGRAVKFTGTELERYISDLPAYEPRQA